MSGKLVKDFAEDVDRDVQATGMPGTVAAIKNLLSRTIGGGEKVETPSSAPAPTPEASSNGSTAPDFVGITRRALEGRRAEALRRSRKLAPPDGEPSDAEVMTWMSGLVRLVAVEKTREDPEFSNVRLHEDPLHPEWAANEGQHLSDLIESISEEGVKVPIIVEQRGDVFLVRAGHRRRKAAMKVGLSFIPAVIFPEGTPIEWQYWANILENTARKTLTTYEVAVSARRMRDRFHIKTSSFARKTGYTPNYVGALVGCLDRLPDFLIEQWRDGARVTIDQWISLSHLEHEAAIRMFRKWTGLSPRDRLRESKSARRRALAPPKWLDRMQRLYVGLEGSDLAPRLRDVCLQVIEHCMGVRDGVPGVYEPGKHKKYEKLAILRNQLKMPQVPEHGEEREMPPPREEIEGREDVRTVVEMTRMGR